MVTNVHFVALESVLASLNISMKILFTLSIQNKLFGHENEAK